VFLLIAPDEFDPPPSDDAGAEDEVSRNSEDRELQTTLRNAAAVGLFVLLAVIILAAVFAPYFDRAPDTTLILGLTGSILGAILMLLGIQTVINRRENGNGK
jgi:hypothetical protein